MQVPSKRHCPIATDENLLSDAESEAESEAVSEYRSADDGPEVSASRGGNFDEFRPAALRIMMEHMPDNPATWASIENTFNDRFPDSGPKHLRRWLKYVHATVLQTGSPKSRVRSGRPPELSAAHVRQCVTYFKKGIGSRRSNDWYGFTSIEHAAYACPQIAHVLRVSGVRIKTLWRRMCDQQLEDFGTKFRKITISVRPQLSEKVKRKRLDAAREWAKWTMDDMRCIFWIDEKQEYLGGIKYRCYSDDNAHSYAVESHAVLGSKQKLKYIAVVNAVLGAVYMALISGTTDLENEYKVRTRIPA